MTRLSSPRWFPREPPLTAVAVVARGRAAGELAAAVLAGLDDGRTARLRAACGEGWLLLLSDEPSGADLPWADGVHWLGEDGGVLLPAHLRVEPHPALLVRAPHNLLVVLPQQLLSAPHPRRLVTAEQLREVWS